MHSSFRKRTGMGFHSSTFNPPCYSGTNSIFQRLGAQGSPNSKLNHRFQTPTVTPGYFGLQFPVLEATVFCLAQITPQQKEKRRDMKGIKRGSGVLGWVRRGALGGTNEEDGCLLRANKCKFWLKNAPPPPQLHTLSTHPNDPPKLPDVLQSNSSKKCQRSLYLRSRATYPFRPSPSANLSCAKW